MKKILWGTCICAFLGLTGGLFSVCQAATPTVGEMWEIIQQQQKMIEQLQSKLAATEDEVRKTHATVEATADVLDEVVVKRLPGGSGRQTFVGGYGELHYNSLDDNETAEGDDSIDQTDLHRFVLYFGHEFTDNIRFFSELEVEHSFVAGDGSSAGEVEIEQSWLEMDINEYHRIRGGLDILPIGIINPLHEPNTFYGVERNKIETEIIPATWWEAGLGLNGELAPGWNYDIVLHSGLVVPTSGNTPFRPRDGRLKLSEATDQDFAVTGRIRYTGIPGLELGVSGQFQNDITGIADNYDINATLLEGHVDWKHASGFGLRALYARWDMYDDNGLDPDAFNAGTLDGFYIEPAYRFDLPKITTGEFGIFARYSRWDERNRLDAPNFRYEEFDQFSMGINWWPHPSLAVKFDAQWEGADGPVDRTLDGINLGMAYQF